MDCMNESKGLLIAWHEYIRYADNIKGKDQIRYTWSVENLTQYTFGQRHETTHFE